MALAEGTRVYVAYDLPPPELYHERYVLAACACGQGYHVVLTPDYDIYAEQISLENGDLANYRIAVGAELGLTAANTYRFRALPGPVEMAQLRRDALQAAAAMAIVPGGGGVAAPVVVPAPGVAAAAAAVGDEVWVCIETGDGRVRGDVIAVDGTEVIHGEIGLKADGQKHFAIRRMRRT